MYYIWLSRAIGILWIALALVTLSSVVLDTTLLAINIVVGIFFSAVGVYLLIKAKITRQLINEISNAKDANGTVEARLHNFIVLQNVSNVIHLLVIVIMLMAACSRVFGEGFPVFG